MNSISHVPLIRRWLALIFVTALSACASQTKVPDGLSDQQRGQIAQAETFSGYLILYDEMDRDGLGFQSRALVTQRFIRFDHGPKSEDYLLFDYQTGQISSVVAEDETVMVMRSPRVAVQVVRPRWSVRTAPSRAVIPGMNTLSPDAEHHEYFLQGRSCLNVVSMAGELEEVVVRLRAYAVALGATLSEHYQPENRFIDECHQSIHVLSPALRFQHGFPIRVWSATGEQRFVQKISRGVEFDASLFTIPAGYRRY